MIKKNFGIDTDFEVKDLKIKRNSDNIGICVTMETSITKDELMNLIFGKPEETES